MGGCCLRYGLDYDADDGASGSEGLGRCESRCGKVDGLVEGECGVAALNNIVSHGGY